MSGTGLAQAAAALLGGTLHHAVPLAGGDLSQVLRVTLADGRQAIVKGGPAPRVEAAMLRAISATGAPAPDVLAVGDKALVLQPLQGGGGAGSAWSSLGTALARLHAATGQRYGWPDHYAFGDVRIDNTWADDWPSFWAYRRLLCHAPFLPTALARRVEALARDCPNRLPTRPPPALLHGDLWGGNVVAANRVVTGLIDPACYYGHGEVDIAMLGLFDHPSPAFFDAYGALEPGADARLIIYKLWPALVHFRLFGSGYRGMVEGFLTSAGE